MNKNKFKKLTSFILTGLLCANLFLTSTPNVIFASGEDVEAELSDTFENGEISQESFEETGDDQQNSESIENSDDLTSEPVQYEEEKVEEGTDSIEVNEPSTTAEQTQEETYADGDFSMILEDPNAASHEANAELIIYEPEDLEIDSESGVSYHASPMWHERYADYVIFTHDYVPIRCNRRYGYYFYTASGAAYHVDYVHKFVEVIEIDEQRFTVKMPAKLHSEPLDEDVFFTGTMVPNGTYLTKYQSSGRYYIETEDFSGWVDADEGVPHGNIQELDFAVPFLNTNSIDGVPIQTLLIPETNTVTRPGSVIRPLYVTIHNTGVNGAGADAYAHANLQYRGNSAQSSWHFSVDDHEIWQSVPMDEMAYHSGDGAAMGNAATIGIEICENSDGNYRQAEINAAKLTARILHAQGLPANAIRQHNDWNGKNCPQNMREMTNGSMGWDAFLTLVAQEYAKLGPVTYGANNTNTSNVTGQATGKTASEPTLTYEAMSYVKGSSGIITEPNTAGTTGQNLGVYAINLNVENAPNASFIANTQIEWHGEDISYSSKSNITLGLDEKMPIEVINLDLRGVDGYKLQYRVHSSNIGWQAWVDEGKDAGEAGNAIQAVNFRLVKSSDSGTDEPIEPTVYYQTHVQNVGWQGWKTEGDLSGTSGKSLRLEGIQIRPMLLDGNIEYRTHIQNIGWEDDWSTDGEISGTSGRSLRLEAIQIKLTGNVASEYDIYYRVHAENFGWLDWAKNGESAGTAGYSYRLEAIEIKLVKKGEAAPGKTDEPFVGDSVQKFASVNYTTHVQNVGWQSYVKDGAVAGTYGKSLRLEGIKIDLDKEGYSGNILYRTHIQNIGWETSFKKNDAMSGTSGLSLRLEAIEIKLDGEMAEVYDVYYRVHAQNIGWMGWAKNGAPAGTAGYSYRLEGIQIELVKKGETPPGSTANAYIEK